MDRARETLTKASHKLAEQMYKAAQPQGGAGTQPGPGAGPSAGAGAEGGDGQAKKDEGVIDAEYVDVEDKK
jgi:molecular chaperone DnaK